MSSQIQMLLAQAGAKPDQGAGAPAGSAIGESTEDLCARAGNNVRKRQALGCPPLEAGGVNDPNLGLGTGTPGDPDIGEQAPAPEAAPAPETNLVDLAKIKVEMGMPETMTPEEKAAWEQFQAAQAAPPEAEPTGIQKILGMFGVGG